MSAYKSIAFLLTVSLAAVLLLIRVFITHRPKTSDYTAVIPKADNDELTLKIPIDSLLAGPGHYQDRLDGHLSSIIRERFLVEPSQRPYNLSSPVKLDGQHGQPRPIDKMMGGRRNGFFVECGALDGQKFSNSLFFELKRNWTGLLIEANSKAFSELIQKHRRAYSINACLSVRNYAERLDFLDAGVVGGLKEVKSGPLIDNLRRQRSDKADEVVQCFPLYPILLALGNPPVDLFSLDVEGSEMGVIESIPWEKVNIKTLLVEVISLNRTSLIEFMAKRGYRKEAEFALDFYFVKV